LEIVTAFSPDSGITTTPIPILLCFDSGYARFAAVATFSAHERSSSDLKFYWLTTKDVKELAARLKAHLEIFGININLICVDPEVFGGWRRSQHLTSATYLRLLAHEHVLEEKIIYLDCDTVTIGDISDLYKVQFSGEPFAGVVDPIGANSSKVPRASSDAYINTGVLIMNLKALRDRDFFRAVSILYQKHEQEITWLDQCLINKFAEGDKLLLDSKWNRQISSEKTTCSEFRVLSRPDISSILHFVGAYKPWQDWCNPAISEFWWEHAKQTKFDGIKTQKIENVNQLIALADAEHLNGNHERSSILKSNVITSLLRHINMNSG
jgi:lipopolysaccharide biosynthesis glycosyltransferase